jgi:hypothetical protein
MRLNSLMAVLGKGALARQACRYMPDECLVGLGTLFYRHID